MFNNYEQLLLDCGVPLAEEWPQEVGLRRNDALLAINLLRIAKRPILGGDVYRMSSERKEPAYANWHCDADSSEELAAYASRSAALSIKYITDFPATSDNSELLFVLVVARCDRES
ncbi:MAG: Imm40 family immunity protein [Planctomyces sp.]|jgi:hypothetical protein